MRNLNQDEPVCSAHKDHSLFLADHLEQRVTCNWFLLASTNRAIERIYSAFPQIGTARCEIHDQTMSLNV